MKFKAGEFNRMAEQFGRSAARTFKPLKTEGLKRTMITTTTKIEANSVTITTTVPIDAVQGPIDPFAFKAQALAVKELEEAAFRDLTPIDEASEAVLSKAGRKK